MPRDNGRAGSIDYRDAGPYNEIICEPRASLFRGGYSDRLGRRRCATELREIRRGGLRPIDAPLACEPIRLMQKIDRVCVRRM